MAAATTVGSNHNSRANDGEIRAGRGFWPGLSATLKHSSRFASFVLVAKGDYPYELDIPLPFSLVSNNERLNRLQVMPAYFWMHNLYALERNSWKSLARDKRKIKKQRIETNYLAPDTAEEIITALTHMDQWMKSAGEIDEDKPLPATGLEGRKRDAVILKPRQAFAAYREMLHFYTIKTIAAYFEGQDKLSYTAFASELENACTGERVREWVNLGGQITPAFRVDELRSRIGSGEVSSWNDIHAAYDDMAAAYDTDKAHHAWEVYRWLTDNDKERSLTKGENFKRELAALVNYHRFIAEHVYRSRAKDFSNPLRSITYRNKTEQDLVIGSAESNSFVKLVQEQASLTEERLQKLAARI